MLNILIEYFLDLVTLLDLLSDGIILITLLYSGDAMWFCLSVITILMPYIVAQIPYLGFKLGKNRTIYSEKKVSCTKKTMGYILITPLILAMFVALDTLFLLVGLILTPLILI